MKRGLAVLLVLCSSASYAATLAPFDEVETEWKLLDLESIKLDTARTPTETTPASAPKREGTYFATVYALLPEQGYRERHYSVDCRSLSIRLDSVVAVDGAGRRSAGILAIDADSYAQPLVYTVCQPNLDGALSGKSGKVASPPFTSLRPQMERELAAIHLKRTLGAIKTFNWSDGVRPTLSFGGGDARDCQVLMGSGNRPGWRLPISGTEFVQGWATNDKGQRVRAINFMRAGAPNMSISDIYDGPNAAETPAEAAQLDLRWSNLFKALQRFAGVCSSGNQT